MNKIPTPETDAAEAACRESKGCVNLVFADDMADLERRLTIARDALKIVARYPIAQTHRDGPCLDRFDILEVCHALALTAPKQ